MNPLDTRTLDTLDWQTVLQHLSSACRTHRGATHALNLPLVQDGAACDALYTAVQEVEALEETGERIPVGSVGEIEPYVRRTEQGQVLDAVELAAVGSTLNALDDLRIWLMERDEEGPLLADQMQAMSLDPELTERLIFSFDDKGQLSESTNARSWESSTTPRALERPSSSSRPRSWSSTTACASPSQAWSGPSDASSSSSLLWWGGM